MCDVSPLPGAFLYCSVISDKHSLPGPLCMCVGCLLTPCCKNGIRRTKGRCRYVGGATLDEIDDSE